MRKLLPIIIILIELLFVVLGTFTDMLGLGRYPGLGLKHISLIIIGVFIIISGIFLTLPPGHRLLQRLENMQVEPSNPKEMLLKLMIMGSWFGLITGLSERIILWSFRRLGWLTGPYKYLGRSLEIIWISAVFDFLLFLIIGLFIWSPTLYFKRFLALALGIYSFSFLALLDFFNFSGCSSGHWSHAVADWETRDRS